MVDAFVSARSYRAFFLTLEVATGSTLFTSSAHTMHSASSSWKSLPIDHFPPATTAAIMLKCIPKPDKGVRYSSWLVKMLHTPCHGLNFSLSIRMAWLQICGVDCA